MARLFFSERGLNIMPKNRVQGFVFGVLMSITMAYGMEVYNIAMKEGGLEQMTNRVFRDALLETSYMWLFVLLFLIYGEIVWGIVWQIKSVEKRITPFCISCLHRVVRF